MLVTGRCVVLLCSAFAAWAVALVVLWTYHGSLLDWDEVDYVNAANLGVVGNAFEAGSLSVIQFAEFGFSKIRGGNPVLPGNYDEGRDPLLLRHFHPPFVVFLLSVVSGSRSERVLRLVQVLGALMLAVTAVFSYRSISESAGWYGLLLVSLLVVWMSVVAFRSISFHGWEAVWTTAAAALLGKLGQVVLGKKTTVGILLCGVLALTVVTLETGLVVWAGAFVWLGIVRLRRSRPGEAVCGGHELLVGLALTVVLVGLVWPGSVTKMSLLKNVANHAYAVRLGREYESVSYGTLGESLLPIVALAPAALLSLALVGRSEFQRWGSFVVIGVLYGGAMVRFALQPQYLIPAVAPLVCVVGIAGDRVSGVGRRGLLIAVVCLLIAAAWPKGVGSLDERARDDLRWLGGVARGQEVLVDGGHVYRFYLGADFGIRPVLVDYNGGALIVRETGRYRELSAEEISGRVVVIQGHRRSLSFNAAQRLVFEKCRAIERATIRVFDCRQV